MFVLSFLILEPYNKQDNVLPISHHWKILYFLYFVYILFGIIFPIMTGRRHPLFLFSIKYNPQYARGSAEAWLKGTAADAVPQVPVPM